MLATTFPWLILIAALGCGIVGGVFFAFSTFIMRALDRLSPAQSIVAMQSINLVVINPLFLGAFLGTAVLCIVNSSLAVMQDNPAVTGGVCAGSMLYLIGTFGVTMAANVPLNNRLAAVAPDANNAAECWRNYRTPWTRWNHLRTFVALAACAALMLAFSIVGIGI